MDRNTITVKVPATSANCGPGFDVLGLAVALYNEFTFREDTSLDGLVVSYEGEGADLLAAEAPEDNLLLQAIERVFTRANSTKRMVGTIHSRIAIPPARGLGSSATAIVGGLALANAFLDAPFSRQDLLEMATAMEGHPDNVCPAIFGELCCSVKTGEKVVYTQVSLPDELQFVVVSPDCQVSTHEARAVLPKTIPFKEAVSNVGAMAFLLTAIEQRRWELLSLGLTDYLHVPYRTPLIPHAIEVLTAAERAGAHGATISGSGSTLIAYITENGETIGRAMVDTFAKYGIPATYKIVKTDKVGYQVI